MGREEIIQKLRSQIKDIENRPHVKSMLKGLSGDTDPINIQDSHPQVKPKMFWSNLRKNRCAKCGSELTWSKDGKLIVCVVCDFKIDMDKFNQISSRL